jgi:hypothetical protein
MNAMDDLLAASRHYQQVANNYRRIAIEAAEAEAAHKSARAQAMLRFKASTSERMSHAEAETRAEADDAIAGLYRDRLVKAALAEAHREKLRQLREQVATGRTAVVAERETDRLHASDLGG